MLVWLRREGAQAGECSRTPAAEANWQPCPRPSRTSPPPPVSPPTCARRTPRCAPDRRARRGLAARARGAGSGRGELPVAARRGAARPGRIDESIATLERVLASAPGFRRRARGSGARLPPRRPCRGGARRSAAGAREAPHHHRAWLAYGDVLVDLGQYGDARIAFERARLTDPERARDRGGDRGAGRRRAQARRGALPRDPAAGPESRGGAVRSGGAVARRRRAARCRAAAASCAEAVGAPAAAYRGLGPALLALGRLEEAEAAARHLLQIEPENPQTWVTMAAVATRLMRQEEALEAYQRAARLKPDELRLRMSIGHVQKTLGRRADSEASYKAALQMDPGSARRTGASRTSRTTPSAMPRSRPCSSRWREGVGKRPTRRSCISRSARRSSSAGATREAFAHYARATRCGDASAVRHRRLRAPQRAHPRVLQRRVLRGPRAAAATRAPRRSSSSGCRARVRR